MSIKILESKQPEGVQVGTLSGGETFVRRGSSVHMVISQMSSLENMKHTPPSHTYVIELAKGDVFSMANESIVEVVDLESTLVRK